MVTPRHRPATAWGRTRAGWRSAWWSNGLLGLLLALFLAGSVPAVHGHEGPGLYDEECPLVWLAVRKPGVPMPSVPV
ncbi:MAG: hypothetical protein ACREMY_09000, partial [bacterium]